jgi:hypothetical protein
MRVSVPGRQGNAITRLAAMPGKKQLAGVLAVAATAVAISGCGSSDSNTIPPTNAATLTQELSAVESAISSGKCGEAQQHAQAFVDSVNNLPETVGTGDKDTLRAAGENLEKLAGDPSQCKPPPPATGASGETSPEPTTTAPTTTAPTTTTEATTTSTETSTTSEPPPPGNSGGGGDTGGGPSTDTGGGGDTGGGSGGTGGTGTGGTGGTSGGGGGTG